MESTAPRELGVLGPTVLRAGGATVAVRPRERQLLTALALNHPQPVGVEQLSGLLWGDDAPASAKVTIQNHVSRLRRALGADAIATEEGRYRLGPTWSLDLGHFDEAAERARRRGLAGDAPAARVQLERALALRRGEAFADLPSSPYVLAARARRNEVEALTEEDLVLAMLAMGDHATAAGMAAALVEASPDRELRWAILALARYRGSQRRGALQALAESRRALRDDAGIDIGSSIARMEALILADDPSLVSGRPAALVGHGHIGSARSTDRTEVYVGRVEELEGLRVRLLQAFDEQHGDAFEVRGPEGVGVTRFLQQAAAQAAIDGWDVAITACNLTPLRSLEPLGDLVRQVLDREPDPERSFDSDLIATVTTLWDPSAGRARGDLAEAIIDVIAAHGARRPTLLTIDDAHHLTPTAAQVLRQIAELAVPIVVLVGHSGPTRVAGWESATTAIELRGLDLDDAHHLLHLVSGGTVDVDLARAVVHATEGLPGPLVRAAHQPGGVQSGSAWRGSGLIDVLVAAAEDAHHLTRRVVELLAVAGGPVPEALLGPALDVLDEAAVETALARAIELGLVVLDSDGLARIVDVRLRRALLDRLDASGLGDRHESLGLALSGTANPLAAAPHLLAVAERNPTRALAVAAEAAAQAAGSSMFAEAADLQGQAADVGARYLGPTDRRTLRMRLGQAESLRRVGDPTGTTLAWEVAQAAEAGDDHETFALAAAALCRVGPLIEAGTLNEDLAEVVERAIRGCTTPSARSICASQAVLFYSMTGRIDRMSSHFHESLRQARLASDDEILLQALGGTYIALTHPDELAERIELTEEMLAVAERIDDDHGRFEALHGYFSNQLQTADPLLRTTFARQEALAVRLRTADRRWMAGYQRACLAYLDGQLDVSLRIGTEIHEQAPVAPSRSLTTYWMNLLVVRLAQGREQELAVTIDEVIVAQPALPGWRAVAAWLAARRGDHDRVHHECAVLDLGRALPRDMSWSGAAMLLGRAVAASGGPSDVAALDDLLSPFRRQMTWIGSFTVGPFDVALTELAMAAGDPEGAAQHLADAQWCVDRLQAVVYQPDLDRLRAALFA